MRLTKAFTRAVIADIPKIDYHEQMQKLLQEQVLVNAPPEVLKLYRTAPQYLVQRMVHIEGFGGYVYVRGLPSSDDDDGHEQEWPPEVQVKLDELVKASAAQRHKLKEMENLLSRQLSVCRTVERARDLLPAELVKYLPQGDAPPPDRTVPAVDVVEKLKEMGWPK